MIEKRTSLEVIAPSVEEAIARGLEDLGLTEEAVDVEVLDAGSRGLFGLGSRQSRVRLTIKSGTPIEEEQVKPETSFVNSNIYLPESVEEIKELSSEVFPVEAEKVKGPGEGQGEEEYILQVAAETVRELLEKMQVRASVSAHYGKADDAHSKPPVQVDVRGNDLSILIGPRAETLNALQYISGLIAGKELGRAIPLVVDVEGYRARREQQIRQLARRMAEQAIKTGKRQVLEPMPASERRLIHIELRGHPQVATESIGEEPRRKVTIFPKK